MSYVEACKKDGIKRTFTTWLQIFKEQPKTIKIKDGNKEIISSK